MEEINTTFEELGIGDEPQFYSTLNIGATISDSSMRGYPNDNGVSTQKELSDEELVRSFVETQDEEIFN